MKNKLLGILALFAVARVRARPARSRASRKAAGRRLAHLSRRLLRPPLQHAEADQRLERESPDAGLGLPREYVATAGAIVGGEGPEAAPGADGHRTIKSDAADGERRPLLHVPDHAWAVDARTGREIWHYAWKTKGGIHIGNRGVGMYGNWLFFETPDCYLVSLDATTGKERWHQQIADVKQEYFCTPAPMVIGNHVIVGMGGDSLDVPG